MNDGDLLGSIRYRTFSNPADIEQVLAPALDHFFNHQTHHRGQAHALLSSIIGNDATPSFDLIIYQRETGQGGLRKLNCPSSLLALDYAKCLEGSRQRTVSAQGHHFMATNRVHRIAVIPGDGIGKEVMPEGLRVLEAAVSNSASRCSSTLRIRELRLLRKARPDDARRLEGTNRPARRHLFRRRRLPDRVPDHVSLWGSLLLFRREFDQYINLRPARLMPGVPCPLAGRKPGDIDMLIVRENTEGEYSAVGGTMFEGTEREIVMQETVMSRTGSTACSNSRSSSPDRAEEARHGRDQEQRHLDHHAVLGRARRRNGKRYPDVTSNKLHIDILTARFVLNPDCFDVVVATNLFGDILSDLGPACTGTIGIAPPAT